MSLLCLALVGGLWIAAPNPVLPKTADAGVLRYAGTYYLMGVGTSGSLYISNDLVHWSGPEHAFSMDNAWAAGPAATDDNIHACDLLLHNGIFHLYWSVNKGPLRQIGHASAPLPTGTYQEPEHTVPFDGRIDPHCFQDDDGRLYFYTVKFTGGNVIWGQPMTGPAALSGKPIPLLTPLRDSWETLDAPPQLVNEGPFVIKYRGTYYMIYNANHTSPRFGHYALGVAEADSPLGFTNSGKYPFPVLRSNRDPKHADVQPSAELPEVKNAGQPNLVRGPNGIEWWLVYFADEDCRSQYIDRVHFFHQELFVEGPTVAGAPGYHPAPAMPSFQDLFKEQEPLAEHWILDNSCRKETGALRISSDRSAVYAYARVPDARNYVLETVLQCQGDQPGRLGVLAWQNGQGSMLRIGLDRARNAAFYAIRQKKHEHEHLIPLPSEFNWAGPHAMRVENNEGVFTVFLDAIRLDTPKAILKKYSPGKTGLFAENGSASFMSFSLTRGWDEWGDHIHGWNSRAGKDESGRADGLKLRPGQTVFKGDALAQYEFAVQLQGKDSAGIYPVYVDDKNYIQVTVNADFTQVDAMGKRHGEKIPEYHFTVHPRIHRAHSASANGNHLRAVKLKDKVILWAEGFELGEITGDWPDSRVGLFAGSSPCAFDSLTLYELP